MKILVRGSAWQLAYGEDQTLRIGATVLVTGWHGGPCERKFDNGQTKPYTLTATVVWFEEKLTLDDGHGHVVPVESCGASITVVRPATIEDCEIELAEMLAGCNLGCPSSQRYYRERVELMRAHIGGLRYVQSSARRLYKEVA